MWLHGIKHCKGGIYDGVNGKCRSTLDLLASLISRLFADNQTEKLKLVAEDEEIRKKFYREYGLSD